jgi:predicted nuclease of predicted toxin-antitoxin system
LVDASLPPRLGVWLQQHAHQATHLFDLDALRVGDSRVWALALTRQEIIVTKDTDFLERALLRGQPPQVILIALGNCTNDALLQCLASSWTNIEAELTGGARLIVVRPDRLEIFA